MFAMANDQASHVGISVAPAWDSEFMSGYEQPVFVPQSRHV
jgi:hypothetical protein